MSANNTILPMIMKIDGILYAQPVADVLSVVVTVFMAVQLHKRLREMQKSTIS